jgi:hypothetical protein
MGRRRPRCLAPFAYFDCGGHNDLCMTIDPLAASAQYAFYRWIQYAGRRFVVTLKLSSHFANTIDASGMTDPYFSFGTVTSTLRAGAVAKKRR